jgi:hypothetical protein
MTSHVRAIDVPSYALGISWLVVAISKALAPQGLAEHIETWSPARQLGAAGLVAWAIILWEAFLGVALVFPISVVQGRRLPALGSIATATVMIVVVVASPPSRQCGCMGRLVRLGAEGRLIALGALLALSGLVLLISGHPRSGGAVTDGDHSRATSSPGGKEIRP